MPRRRGVRPPHVRLDVVGGAGLAVHRRSREGPVADDLRARADDRREEPLGPRVGRAHHVREVVAREPDDVARRLRRAAPPREHLVGDVAEVVRQAREAAHGDREGPVADAERHLVLLDVLLRVLPLGLALLLLLRVVLAESEHRREEAEDEESRAHLEARPRREARDAADRRAVPPLAERLERPLEVLDRGVGERPPGVEERGEPPLAVEVHRDVAGVAHRVRDVLRVGLAVALRHLAVGRVGGDAGRHLDHRVPVLGELLEAVHPVADVGHRVAPRADAREVAELRGHRPELAVELPLDVREVLRRHAADAPAVLRPFLRVPLDERGPVAVVEHGPRRAERVAGEHEMLKLRRARRAEGGVEVPRRLRVVGGPVRDEERRRPRRPQRGEGRGHAAEPVDEPMVDEGLLLEGRADGRCVGAREPPLLDLFLRVGDAELHELELSVLLEGDDVGVLRLDARHLRDAVGHPVRADHLREGDGRARVRGLREGGAEAGELGLLRGGGRPRGDRGLKRPDLLLRLLALLLAHVAEHAPDLRGVRIRRELRLLRPHDVGEGLAGEVVRAALDRRLVHLHDERHGVVRHRRPAEGVVDLRLAVGVAAPARPARALRRPEEARPEVDVLLLVVHHRDVVRREPLPGVGLLAREAARRDELLPHRLRHVADDALGGGVLRGAAVGAVPVEKPRPVGGRLRRARDVAAEPRRFRVAPPEERLEVRDVRVVEVRDAGDDALREGLRALVLKGLRDERRPLRDHLVVLPAVPRDEVLPEVGEPLGVRDAGRLQLAHERLDHLLLEPRRLVGDEAVGAVGGVVGREVPPDAELLLQVAEADEVVLRPLPERGHRRPHSAGGEDAPVVADEVQLRRVARPCGAVGAFLAPLVEVAGRGEAEGRELGGREPERVREGAGLGVVAEARLAEADVGRFGEPLRKRNNLARIVARHGICRLDLRGVADNYVRCGRSSDTLDDILDNHSVIAVVERVFSDGIGVELVVERILLLQPFRRVARNGYARIAAPLRVDDERLLDLREE